MEARVHSREVWVCCSRQKRCRGPSNLPCFDAARPAAIQLSISDFAAEIEFAAASLPRIDHRPRSDRRCA